jgi:hypothetical protein
MLDQIDLCHHVPLRLERKVQRFLPTILQKSISQKIKKEQGEKPCSENCVDPYFPENLDLILMDGATLLVRARAPPETWTTRLKPCGSPEPALLDHLFPLVIIFSNDCSKFEQFMK